MKKNIVDPILGGRAPVAPPPPPPRSATAIYLDYSLFFLFMTCKVHVGSIACIYY